jgi:hypothetical protein
VGTIEHAAEALVTAYRNPQRRSVGLLAGAILAILLSVGGFLLHGGGPNGVRFADNLMLFSSSLVFVFYYAAVPVSRLVPAAEVLGAYRFSIAYGFVGMVLVFLVSLLAPDYAAARIPLPTLGFAALTVLVAVAFLIGAGSKQARNSATLRTLQSLSSGYFWMVFAVMDLDRMQGPHRPDPIPYGLSLLLLVAVLLVRFADAFVERHRAGMPARKA